MRHRHHLHQVFNRFDTKVITYNAMIQWIRFYSYMARLFGLGAGKYADHYLYIKCEKCGYKAGTLRKIKGHYYCEYHVPEKDKRFAQLPRRDRRRIERAA